MISRAMQFFADMFALLILGAYHSVAKLAVFRLDRGRVCGAISDHVQRNTPIYIPLLIHLIIRLMERHVSGTLRISSLDCVGISVNMYKGLSASFGSLNSRLEAHRISTPSLLTALTIIWLRDGGMKLSEAMTLDTSMLELALRDLSQDDTAQYLTRPNTQQN